MTRILDECRKFDEFSLLGGPLHRLGRHLGLVRDGTNTLLLGLALGGFLWIVLALLTLFEGLGDQVFSLSVIGGHVRLLVAIPLFFVCESLIGPRGIALVETLVRSEVVPQSASATLDAELTRAVRRADAWLPDTVCLLVAVSLSLIGPFLNLPGVTAAYDPARSVGGEITLTGAWFWIVCMTVFRFLLLRWLWRLASWCYFLWRLSSLDLRLVPTHPDGAAGLGYLEVVQTQFSPLILALSTIQCAMFAEALSVGKMAFEEIYSGMALLLIAVALLFVGPACIFSRKLWTCRIKGLTDYMALAAHYVGDFDKKWLMADDARRKELLGTADLQSLADLNNSMAIVREMRLVPMSTRMLTEFGLATLVPAMPLLLFKYPLAELAQQLVARLSGL